MHFSDLTYILHNGRTDLSDSSIQIIDKGLGVHHKTRRLVITELLHHPVDIWGTVVKEISREMPTLFNIS